MGVRRIAGSVLTLCVGFSVPNLFAKTPAAGAWIAVQDLELQIPAEWKLHQNAFDNDTIILGFESGDRYLTLFVKKARATTDNLRTMFVNEVTVVSEAAPASFNGNAWQVLHTMRAEQGPFVPRQFVTSFWTTRAGFTYYGYSAANSASMADQNVEAFLSALQTK